VLGCDQPGPHRTAQRRRVGRRADPLQGRQLVGPGPREQRPDQAVLGPEEEQQHARARSDGGELYAAEFDWDSSFEALVARIVADHAQQHDPAREAAWIAELDGQRVGCVFCVAADERMRLWTNHPLAAARRIYLAEGFALVEEEPHTSFGAELVGQVYERFLT
jgi:hypothetical protein